MRLFSLNIPLISRFSTPQVNQTRAGNVLTAIERLELEIKQLEEKVAYI